MSLALNTSTSSAPNLRVVHPADSGKTVNDILAEGMARPFQEAMLEELAEEALEADIEFKAAELRKDSAKKALKEALQAAGKLDGDTHAVGIVRTIIKKTRRFSPDLANQLLTAEEIAKYSTVNSALVKANVAPAAYELMQADLGWSLEVKVDTGK